VALSLFLNVLNQFQIAAQFFFPMTWFRSISVSITPERSIDFVFESFCPDKVNNFPLIQGRCFLSLPLTGYMVGDH
jgi:hypothetical protein